MLGLGYYSGEPDIIDTSSSIFGCFLYKNWLYFVILQGTDINLCLLNEIFEITPHKMKIQRANNKEREKTSPWIYIYNKEFYNAEVD